MTSSKRTRTKPGQLSQATEQSSSSDLTGNSPEVQALRRQLGQVTLGKVNELTADGNYAEFFAVPTDLDKAVAELKTDLTEVPVVSETGNSDRPLPQDPVIFASQRSRQNTDLEVPGCRAKLFLQG